MMIVERVNKKILALHFSKSAESYDSLAHLQREIAYQLVDWALAGENIRPGKLRVLEIGCGTGFLTCFLIQRIVPELLVAVDLAHGMLDQARLNLSESLTRVELVRADGEKLPFPGRSFDLVASSTTFQWFDSLGESLSGLYALLRPGGRIFFSTLGRDTLKELKESYRSSAGQMGIKLTAGRYGRPLAGPQEIKDCLENTGYTGVSVKEMFKFEFFPSARDFLLSLKKSGANNPNFRPMSLPVERKLLEKVTSFYDKRYRVDGSVYASYQVIFASGKKPGGADGA